MMLMTMDDLYVYGFDGYGYGYNFETKELGTYTKFKSHNHPYHHHILKMKHHLPDHGTVRQVRPVAAGQVRHHHDACQPFQE